MARVMKRRAKWESADARAAAALEATMAAWKGDINAADQRRQRAEFLRTGRLSPVEMMICAVLNLLTDDQQREATDLYMKELMPYLDPLCGVAAFDLLKRAAQLMRDEERQPLGFERHAPY